MSDDSESKMGTAPLLRLILVLSLPIAFSTLVQSLYNIVDSVFVARYSDDALIALSLVFPIQLLMIALATGTGVGINALMSIMLGKHMPADANNVARQGLFLGVVNWIVFTAAVFFVLVPYFRVSTDIPAVFEMGVSYTRIILIFSFGVFIESVCSKIMQATGRMVLPMIAQIAGAVLNIVLDPIMIFGLFGCPEMGVEGAAIATVLGQTVTMIVSLYGVFCGRGIITVRPADLLRFRPDPVLIRRIFRMAVPSIFMQALYTVYIMGLNLILADFSESAVSVLGIYYKLQTFLCIPFQGFIQATMPIMSYSYGAGYKKRLWRSLFYCCTLSTVFLTLGMIVFLLWPEALIMIFTASEEVLRIGIPGLRIISLSFVAFSLSLMLPSFFQAIGYGRASMFLTVLRQIVLMVPVAYLLAPFGLTYVWLTFPISETVTAVAGLLMIVYFRKRIIPNPRPEAGPDSER